PMRPKLPEALLRYLAPSDSAASSTMGTLYRPQSATIGSISALWPYRLTTITAFGNRFFRREISNACSSATGDIFQLSGSESIKTEIGRASCREGVENARGA